MIPNHDTRLITVLRWWCLLISSVVVRTYTTTADLLPTVGSIKGYQRFRTIKSVRISQEYDSIDERSYVWFLCPGWAFKVVVRSCHGAYSVASIFLNIWRQILFRGGLHDAAFQNFCTTKCGTFTCPCGLQIPARWSNYDCPLLLNYSAYSTWLSW